MKAVLRWAEEVYEFDSRSRVHRLHIGMSVGTGLEQYLGSAFCSIDAADLWSQPPAQTHSSQPGKEYCFRMCLMTLQHFIVF